MLLRKWLVIMLVKYLCDVPFMGHTYGDGKLIKRLPH